MSRSFLAPDSLSNEIAGQETIRALTSAPAISVVVLNYNGAPWLERCLGSLREQTIFSQIEIIVADNQSPDQSGEIARKILADWSNGRFVQHSENLGFCEGNNRAAKFARGEFLLFLNNDTWLEKDCLERLLEETRRGGYEAATPLILNYGDNTVQPIWVGGFDLFGFVSFVAKYDKSRELFMPPGCSYLIRRELFQKLGEFDPRIFMYADEFDLSWRVWLSGGKAVAVHSSRVHHRLAANVNPKGQDQILELRTSDLKRYYANRNGLLVLAKNSQHVLWILLLLQILFLTLEGLFSLLLVRRWSFVRRAYIQAFVDCWKLRFHILAERRRIRAWRRRSDWWMLRFLRARLNRWDELKRAFRHGLPKVTPK